jgi:hypothetical protein
MIFVYLDFATFFFCSKISKDHVQKEEISQLLREVLLSNMRLTMSNIPPAFCHLSCNYETENYF